MNKSKTPIFSKPDEMAMTISYQAMRLTWIVVNIIWIGMVIYYFMDGSLSPIPLIALIAAEIIYGVIYGILRWRMTRGGADTE